MMDRVDADPVLIARSLDYLRRVNALLGYTRTTLRHLGALTADWPAGRPLTVLDVATGAADLPVAIERWGGRRGIAVDATGLDLHATTLDRARAALGPAATVRLVRGDALRLPFADSSVDVVTTGLFLHHLDTDDAVVALREMGRVARVGIVAGDLLRHRRAHLWIQLLSLRANPMVRHDAPASVAQGYTVAEARDLAARAGLSWVTCHRHFGHRFVLAGRKPAVTVA
jgi:SAM-dependent methyltransferase